MDDSLNICLPCGLCCDGTLIGFVQLSREELPPLLDLLDIEDEDGEGFFLQPCVKFGDCCTIYTQRPKQCAKFKCGFLKSVEDKELPFDIALELVAEVKEKKIAMEQKLATLSFELKSKSFYFKMVELKRVLKKNISESNNRELLVELNELDSLQSKVFGISLY